MSISSRNNIKSGLCFIKSNFGGIWSMVLKVFLIFIPFLFTLGASFTLMGGLALLTGGINMPPLDSSPQMMIEGPMMQFGEILSNLTAGGITIAVVMNLLALLFPLLALSAMNVAMIRSIVFDEELNTAIFSKLFDKTVLKFFTASLLIVLVFSATIALIPGLALFIGGLSMGAGMMGMMMPALFSLPLLIPVLIYLVLRFALIPLGVAAGDIHSISDAFAKTKGQLWNVFKVMFWAFLISLGLQLITEIPSMLLQVGDNVAIMIFAATLMLALIIIFVPLYQIGTTALSYLYKKIK